MKILVRLYPRIVNTLRATTGKELTQFFHLECTICQIFEHTAGVDSGARIFSHGTLSQWRTFWCIHITTSSIRKLLGSYQLSCLLKASSCLVSLFLFTDTTILTLLYLFPALNVDSDVHCEWGCEDEAHNIDNVCIEALSVDLEEPTLRAASQNVTQLRSAISGAKRAAKERLRQEYTRILSGLPLAEVNAQHARGGATDGHLFAGGEEIALAPVLPNDVLREAVPESIRKAEAFVEFLNKLVSFLQRRAATETVSQEKPTPFLMEAASSCSVVDRRVFQGTYDRLISLLMTVQVSSWSDFKPLAMVGDFITILSTYEREGMAVITEPFNDFTGEYEPILRLACLDASLAIRWIVDRFRTVVITSGTLSPLDTYPKMLNFPVVVSSSFNMSMDRRCVCPLVMTRGSDQMALSSKYNDRQTSDIPRNYGHALVDLAGCVPDGIVVFFVSYVFMQQVVKVWTEECNTLNDLRKLKLVFVETQDPIEASLAIKNYRAACDSGRGAILLSVARGRAAEGIDFDGQYGRAVILFGVPFQYTESRVLKARLQFLAEHLQIQEDDFLVFDVSEAG